MSSKAKKQAVVIIHGIGEQKPMDTLRGFVDSVIPDPKNSRFPKFWSKPDLMSESYELRKLTVPENRQRPKTDFFEFYWAYHIQGTKYMQLGKWFLGLLFRLPKEIPRKIFPLWIFAWAMVLFFMGIYLVNYDFFKGDLKSMFLVFVAFIVLQVINLAVINFLGDAARYLNPSPDNVAERHKIRKDGIELLKRLHESKEYDRIVLVGHSLGSVIGYDILKYLWSEYNNLHDSTSVNQDKLKEIEKESLELFNEYSPDRMNNFQNLQRAFWKEQRALGNPWLVTDFITMGSPLAHAQLLLARSKKELQERQFERELPICPPFFEGDRFHYDLDFISSEGEKRSVKVLHHAGHFACTRWTNFYFKGDIIGGPLREVFGNGIKDIEVKVSGGKWKNFLPLSHVWYWRDKVFEVKENNPQNSAILSLCEALDLNSRVWLK